MRSQHESGEERHNNYEEAWPAARERRAVHAASPVAWQTPAKRCFHTLDLLLRPDLPPSFTCAAIAQTNLSSWRIVDLLSVFLYQDVERNTDNKSTFSGQLLGERGWLEPAGVR